MATNTERLTALVIAIYEDNASPEKEARIASLVQVTDAQAQEKFQKDAAALNANQKAWFVMRAFRDFVKGLAREKAQRSQQEAMHAARQAAQQAAEQADDDL